MKTLIHKTDGTLLQQHHHKNNNNSNNNNKDHLHPHSCPPASLQSQFELRESSWCGRLWTCKVKSEELLPRGTVGQGRVHRGTSLPAVRTLAVRFMSSHQTGLSRSPVIPPRTGSAPPAWQPAPEHASEAGCSPPCPSWEARGRIPESSGTPANTSGGQAGSSQGFHHVTTKSRRNTASGPRAGWVKLYKEPADPHRLHLQLLKFRTKDLSSSSWLPETTQGHLVLTGDVAEAGKMDQNPNVTGGHLSDDGGGDDDDEEDHVPPPGALSLVSSVRGPVAVVTYLVIHT